MKLSKGISVAMALTMSLSLTAGLAGCAASQSSQETSAATANSSASQLASWNEGESLSALTEFVDAVTDENSQDFVPAQDRIAVFDMDGTLIGEHAPIYFDWIMYCNRVLDDSTFTATEKQVDVARQIVEAARGLSSQTGGIPENLESDHFKYAGEVYAGMSIEDYDAYVEAFLNTEADGYEGLTLGEAYFQPMKEVVDYLEANDFIVYVVSGTEREAVRVMAQRFLDIPARQVIGSDYYTASSNQGDADYLDYQLGDEDTLVRTENAIIKNVKMSKVVQMDQEIGQQPVLAFGNSSGDQSMFTYTTANNPYRSAAFCLVPDDDEREYAYPSKVESLKATCDSNGWVAVSMKEDFAQIYGEGVVRNSDNTPWLDRMESLLEKQQ